MRNPVVSSAGRMQMARGPGETFVCIDDGRRLLAESERSVGMVYALVIYVVMGLVTLFVYWRDKRAAVLGGGRRRVRERTLHLLALAGGIVGALAAQQLLRHKRRKLWFIVVTVGIAALHAGGWVVLVWWRLQQ